MSDDSNVLQFRLPEPPNAESATCIDVDGDESLGLTAWLSRESDGSGESRIGLVPAPEGYGWALDADAAEKLGVYLIQLARDLRKEQSA